MLAVPSHLCYVRHPPGIGEYPARSGGAEQFDANTFLIRVDTNRYDAADAGRMLYDTLAGFVRKTFEFKISQIDRCAFAHHKRIGGVWST